MDILSLLPPELTHEIISSLDVCSVLKCGSVCRSWYCITSEDDKLWKQFCLRESIAEDDWNWNIIEWAIVKPSRWKIYYLNCHRTAYNWKHDVNTRYSITGQKINLTGYDGRTMVVYDRGSLNVYKVIGDAILYCQTLDYKAFNAYSWITNTDYIVAAHIDFIIVYTCTRNVYCLDYMIYIARSETDYDCDLTCITDKEMIDSITDKSLHNLFNLKFICTLSYTVFIHIIGYIYAWNLVDKNCILKLPVTADTSYVSDKRLLFVSNQDKVHVYNSDAQRYYTLGTDYKVCKLLLNDNIVLALGVEYFSNLFIDSGTTDRMSAWNKVDGSPMLTGRVLYAENCWLLVSSNVIVILEYDMMIFYLIARQIAGDEQLWKIPLLLEASPFHTVDILAYISVGVMFIYYSISCHSDHRHLIAHNLDNGSLLYSHGHETIKIHAEIRCDLYIGSDILMFTDKHNDQVVIQLYR